MPSENDDTIQVIDNIGTVVAAIKTIKFIENALRKDVHTFSDMKTLNTAYNILLGFKEKFRCNYKKYKKWLILQKVSDVQVSWPNSRREAEILCSEAKRDQLIDQCMNAPGTYNEIYAVASLIRRDILNKNRSKLTVSYDNYEIPTSIEQLLRWIMIGLKDTFGLNVKK